MTKIGDERIAFYLENREHIDEWARLKKEAADERSRTADHSLHRTAACTGGQPVLHRAGLDR